MHSKQQYSRHHQYCYHQLEAELRPTRLRLIHLLLAQLIEQQAGVNARANADGQRQTGVGQRADQHQVEQLHDQGKNRDFYRCTNVLLRIKPGASTLITIIPSKPTE